MLQFCWQWSQNVHQVNTMKNYVSTIQIQNSLLYVACFGNMVRAYTVRKLVSMHWLTVFTYSNHSNESSHILQISLIFHCIYLMNILRPLPVKLEHFYLFDPCRVKNLTFDLFFNNYETVYAVDRSNYTFSESL